MKAVLLPAFTLKFFFFNKKKDVSGFEKKIKRTGTPQTEGEGRENTGSPQNKYFLDTYRNLHKLGDLSLFLLPFRTGVHFQNLVPGSVTTTTG